MLHNSLEDYARSGGRSGAPKAIVLCEDDFLALETAQRLLRLGFAVVAAGPGAAAADREGVDVIPAAIGGAAERTDFLNRLVQTSQGGWALICFNGEFPFFPFCETRRVIDFVDFLRSERRASCMAYTIDLYSDRLIGGGTPDLDDVYFDAEGWYGFDRAEGAVDVYGGLGWRFEEYAPVTMSRVNRPALFRVDEGAVLRDDLWLADEARNTIACPWHANPTMALMSFRRARRLLSHPNFRSAVDTLMWPNSTRFEWRSSQLSALGLIEAGQWI